MTTRKNLCSMLDYDIVHMSVHYSLSLRLLLGVLISTTVISCSDEHPEPNVKPVVKVRTTVSHRDSSSFKPETIAVAEYSIVNGKYLEIRVTNISQEAIALIPTLYTIDEKTEFNWITAGTSVGKVIYWDTARFSQSMELHEPWPRYSPDLPVTVVEIPRKQTARFQFSFDAVPHAHPTSSKLKIDLNYLPAWKITSAFRESIDSTFVITGESVYKMCRRGEKQWGVFHDVCNRPSASMKNRSMFYWLSDNVKDVKVAPSNKRAR